MSNILFFQGFHRNYFYSIPYDNINYEIAFSITLFHIRYASLYRRYILDYRDISLQFEML